MKIDEHWWKAMTIHETSWTSMKLNENPSNLMDIIENLWTILKSSKKWFESMNLHHFSWRNSMRYPRLLNLRRNNDRKQFRKKWIFPPTHGGEQLFMRHPHILETSPKHPRLADKDQRIRGVPGRRPSHFSKNWSKSGPWLVLGRFGLQIRILREKLYRVMGSDQFFINLWNSNFVSIFENPDSRPASHGQQFRSWFLEIG